MFLRAHLHAPNLNAIRMPLSQRVTCAQRMRSRGSAAVGTVFSERSVALRAEIPAPSQYSIQFVARFRAQRALCEGALPARQFKHCVVTCPKTFTNRARGPDARNSEGAYLC